MCGLPDVLYVDHGSDFTSNQLAHTAVDLHIRLIHSTVARPQGRGKIERFFGTINTELLATLPGHITEGHPWPTPKLSGYVNPSGAHFDNLSWPHIEQSVEAHRVRRSARYVS